MSDNPTQEMPDSRSFEERVFARFDSLDARLTVLEEKVDARLRETRPIWEGMKADLESVKDEVKEINRTVKILHKDVLRVRVEQEELQERIEKLESEPTR
jgi:peptidoglycan hydrolase CwlO-like protein